MTYILGRVAAFACMLLACSGLYAQSISIHSGSGYTATSLFSTTASYTINGLAADNAGNVYYIEDDVFGFGNSRLRKRSPLDGYAQATTLFDFGEHVTGTFVAVSGGKLYFGENLNGNIRSISTDGTGVDMLGVVDQNFDGSFFGNALYISHNTANLNGPSDVSKFALVSDGSGGQMLSAGDSIINLPNEQPGQFTYAGGELYYGGSASSLRGLYRFTSAEVVGAVGPTSLTADAAHKFGATPFALPIAGLTFGAGVDLWEAEVGKLQVFDRSNGGTSTIATSTENFGLIDFADGALFATVTDYNTFRSTIYRVAVPEPSSAGLLLAGSLLLARSRRSAAARGF